MTKDYFIECSIDYYNSVNDKNQKLEILKSFFGSSAELFQKYDTIDESFERFKGWFACLK